MQPRVLLLFCWINTREKKQQEIEKRNRAHATSSGHNAKIYVVQREFNNAYDCAFYGRKRQSAPVQEKKLKYTDSC